MKNNELALYASTCVESAANGLNKNYLLFNGDVHGSCQ